MHKEVHLGSRAAPILRGERVGAHDLDTQAHTGGDDLAERDDARLMPLPARETLRGGPAAVAVHDARDMARDARAVRCVELEGLSGGFAKNVSNVESSYT